MAEITILLSMWSNKRINGGKGFKSINCYLTSLDSR